MREREGGSKSNNPEIISLIFSYPFSRTVLSVSQNLVHHSRDSNVDYTIDSF